MRRKPRVVWLPPTNANSFGSSDTSGIQIFAVNTTGAGPVATAEVPLTIDAQSDPLALDTSLADVESSGYRLRRVVGKIFVQCQGSEENTAAFGVVTAGLIVRRVDDSTGASFAILTSNETLINTQEIRNYGDPWIWRRTWLISNPAIFEVDNPFGIVANNYGHGPSAVDGPHVDQKTARIVGPEERLFLDVSVRQNTEDQGEIPIVWTIITDLRVLASMRSSSGNRRNASR